LRAEKGINRPVTPVSLNPKPWRLTGLLFLAAAVLAGSEEPDRVYSLAEVSVIDRENKLWRAMDVTRTVEANVERLLAGGCSPAEVEALRPRLTQMWQVEPWLHFGWLAPGTLPRIEALTPDFVLRMREARVHEMLNRLGGERQPLTSAQVYAQWRTAIFQELDDRELKDVVLLNSAPALALYNLMKGLPLTTDERRSLCLMQQDHLGALQQLNESRSYLSSARINLSREETLLDYWQQMRELLGDDRFSAYLQAADPKFGRMAESLRQIGGIDLGQALNLWWVRKKDELADVRRVTGSERYQLRIQAEESAARILGPEALAAYQAGDDAQWLRRNRPKPLFARQAGSGEGR